jgi:hypothetical protein
MVATAAFRPRRAFQSSDNEPSIAVSFTSGVRDRRDVRQLVSPLRLC